MSSINWLLIPLPPGDVCVSPRVCPGQQHGALQCPNRRKACPKRAVWFYHTQNTAPQQQQHTHYCLGSKATEHMPQHSVLPESHSDCVSHGCLQYSISCHSTGKGDVTSTGLQHTESLLLMNNSPPVLILLYLWTSNQCGVLTVMSYLSCT